MIYSTFPEGIITLLQYVNQLCRDEWCNIYVSVGRHDGKGDDFMLFINEDGRAEFENCVTEAYGKKVELDDPVWGYYVTSHGYGAGPNIDVEEEKPEFVRDGEEDLKYIDDLDDFEDDDDDEDYDDKYEKYADWIEEKYNA